MIRMIILSHSICIELMIEVGYDCIKEMREIVKIVVVSSRWHGLCPLSTIRVGEFSKIATQLEGGTAVPNGPGPDQNA